MAKGIYVGIDGKARKVKKAYVGASGGYVEKEVSSNIIPTTWDTTSSTACTTNDGIKLTGVSSQNGPSSEKDKYYVKSATDTDSSSFWMSGYSNTGWLKLEFPEPKKILSMQLKADYTQTLTKIEIQGSNTGSDSTREWTTLYTTTTALSTLKTVTLTNTDYYKYYRIYFTGTNSGASRVYRWRTGGHIEFEYNSTLADKAHKIKKGYIGVGGIARLFYSAEQKLVYYGRADGLSQAREGLAATTVGDYALFGGGYYSGSVKDTVDTYTSSLAKGTATALAVARYHLAATSIGDYALFAGGESANTTHYSTVDTYTSSLAKGTATVLSVARRFLAATTVGDYALFGGGLGASSGYKDTVDTYTSSLAKGTATALTTGRYHLAATTVGDYAIFAGGRGYNQKTPYKEVNTYNSSLVKGTPTDLSINRYLLTATTVGDYALFAGGYGGGGNYGTYIDTVDTYTSSLVKGTATALSAARSSFTATTVGDYALFAGYVATVDTYTSSLVKGMATDLSATRDNLAATTVGDYALFGGGRVSSGTTYGNVDVYQVV